MFIENQIFFTFKIPNLISCYWTAEQISEQSNFFWNPTKNFIFTSNHQPNVSNFNTFTRYTINFTFILWLNKDVDFLCCCCNYLLQQRIIGLSLPFFFGTKKEVVAGGIVLHTSLALYCKKSAAQSVEDSMSNFWMSTLTTSVNSMEHAISVV